MATKRLKELLEARKSSARDNSGRYFCWKYTISSSSHFYIFFSPPFSLELFDDVLGLNNVGKVCFETKLLISIITCTSQECEFPFMC